MIDVSELMNDADFAKTFVVKRPRVVIAKDGSISTTYLEFETVGVVQPARPADMVELPAGTLIDGVLSVWCHTAIRGSDGNKTESDALLIDCQSYRVIREEARKDNGYFRVFAARYNP